MSDDDLKTTTDSIERSVGRLSTVIDSMDNHSYSMKHTNFEISKAIQKLNDDINIFENNDMKENFTDVVSSDKGFTIIIVVVMILLTLYYYLIYRKQN